MSTVGRLTAIKQHHLFLETAASDRRAATLRRSFWLIGDGELRADLEDAARQLGLADRVRFLGWRRDLPAIYGATDVFLLTSRNEGTPVALIESLAAGVPGVSTDVAASAMSLDLTAIPSARSRRSATRPRWLARSVTRLLADRERRRSMGDRGRVLGARPLRNRSTRRRHRRALSRAARVTRYNHAR